MSHLLIVTSSLSGAASQSNRLVERYARRLAAADPRLQIVRRFRTRIPNWQSSVVAAPAGLAAEDL